MLEINNLFLFMFIFSLFGVTRVLINFLSSVFKNPPQSLIMTRYEIIIFGLFLSYIITYLLN